MVFAVATFVLDAMFRCLVLAAMLNSVHAAECRHVVFSANPDYPPFSWSDRGKLYGASIELTERILRELAVPAEVRYLGPWNRVLRAAKSGQIDLVTALKFTAERDAYLLFTSARFSANPVAVFARAEAPFDYHGWDDLVGRVGLISRGDRFGEGFDEFLQGKLTVQTSNNVEDGFANLARKRGDYFVTGYYAGRAYLAGKGLETRVVALTPMVNQGSVHHGFSRASPCKELVGQMAEKLRRYEADGTTERLLAQYLEKWRATAQSRVP
ncbi:MULTISPECIES: ABC transporter substrate-binding protein [unclassified Roseateles]|uniref:substrate-binding periplasmic protein n=1 Tax=unclassified Roseateles TaxID=2626991 RepID=UPI0006F54A7E|nr:MULTISPECIES: transporter substrate-binding domain-containing protein [unclassified Roseateles]KQW42470.1 hypothetical protein ASC81_21735 [Pelomonas sp. Root405]KRA68344.1 hypothetical protein ASD88_23320 [Pelomonas sp. Root662]